MIYFNVTYSMMGKRYLDMVIGHGDAETLKAEVRKDFAMWGRTHIEFGEFMSAPVSYATMGTRAAESHGPDGPSA